MNLKEKIELIQSSSSKEILNGGGHNGTPLLRFVFQIHEEVFGMPCKSCADALPGYIKKIQSINLNNSIMGKQERKYRMKSGSVIRVHGTNDYYSDANLTDEIAEKLLKVNPNRAQLFAKIPDGALDRLKKEKAKEDAQAKAEAEKEPVKTEISDADDQKSKDSEDIKETEVNESEEVKADKAETTEEKTDSEDRLMRT